MPRSSEETRRRLLVAATEEFAAHGIAGARTGRIARAAEANEALLYRYFGNKEALFEVVYDSLVREATDDVVLDAHRLPEYAGDLVDYYREHGHVLRLSIWAALERPQTAATVAVRTATHQKITAIEAAQQTGSITTRLSASELLTLVIQLSLSGTPATPALGIDSAPEVRRASIVAAVGVLIQP